MAKQPKPALSKDEPPERAAGRVARNRLRIAWMYYVEGLTQNEIADKLGIGRVTVVRNITEAIKQREVKIWIEGEVAECLSLERELKDAFGLINAHVVPEPTDLTKINKSIGMAAGMYTTDQLTDDFVPGVGWVWAGAKPCISPRSRSRRAISAVWKWSRCWAALSRPEGSTPPSSPGNLPKPWVPIAIS